MPLQEKGIKELIERSEFANDFYAIVANFRAGFDDFDGLAFGDVFADVVTGNGQLGTELGTLISLVTPGTTGTVYQDDALAIRQGLQSGTDPNGGGSTSSAVNELRTAASNATSPQYSGDATNDDISDVIKWAVDQQIS